MGRKPHRKKAAKAAAQSAQATAEPSVELTVEQVERLVEEDPTLAPTGPSVLMVEDLVLEPEELQALLDGLAAQFAETEGLPGWDPWSDGLLTGFNGVSHESDPATVGRAGRHSKLSPLAWLFPDHAGVGRSARHQQGHHLRARRRAGKKARPPAGQAQGSLFGTRLE